MVHAPTAHTDDEHPLTTATIVAVHLLALVALFIGGGPMIRVLVVLTFTATIIYPFVRDL